MRTPPSTVVRLACGAAPPTLRRGAASCQTKHRHTSPDKANRRAEAHTALFMSVAYNGESDTTLMNQINIANRIKSLTDRIKQSRVENRRFQT